MNAVLEPSSSSSPGIANAPSTSVARARRRASWLLLARPAIVCGALGGAVAFASPAPPSNDIRGLTQALGEATNGVVDPQDVRWEPSGGVLEDAARGRFVLFLASEACGGRAKSATTGEPCAPRDVWRARVRLTPEGRPLSVEGAHNLTGTALGDDHGLVVRGSRAAFATFAYGQEQSVTALDLSGEGAENTTKLLFDRVMSWLTNVQQTGSGAGIGRVDITLDQPAKSVALALTDDALAVDLGDLAPSAERHARLDLAHGELVGSAPGMHADASRHLPKRPIFWAVDTVRAVPWIGPAPIAWAEERAFAVRDAMKQLAFKWNGAASTDTDTLATAEPAPPPASILDGSQTGADSGHWPPAPIRTIWKTPEAGEGEWITPKLPWTRKSPGDENAAGAPPAFVRTFVRPDEERPYAKVLLVAMDMRQLDLGMEAGVEDPKPMAGPHGAGRLPRDPAISRRVVAAFNGAFKTEHGNYGMMVNKRVLLPPQPGAATVVVLKDTRVALGSWGNTPTVTGIASVPDADIVSFRQNLDPLIDKGEINPTKRALWGYTLPGNGMQTERSGMCVTASGHLVYAWGDDVSATTLAKAMKMANCVYGMHLDMNPHHTGFIFSSIQDLKAHNYRSELLSSQMEISPDRYIDYAAKDFFYVMVHDPTPPPLAGGTAWQPDPGAQPAPTWQPGIWSARVDDGIEVLDVEPGRASFRIRAGSKEPNAQTGAAPLRELADDDAHRVLFAAGLGVAHEKRPRGLATDGRMVLQFGDTESAAALVAAEDGALRIVKASELGTLAPHADAAEVPLILDGGIFPTPDASPVARAALGITAEGRVLLARGTAASHTPLAEALRKAGCVRAVALDRGASAAPTLQRAGTATPPRAHYDDTTLYAIATPLRPRAFRFEAQSAVAQAPPK